MSAVIDEGVGLCTLQQALSFWMFSGPFLDVLCSALWASSGSTLRLPEGIKKEGPSLLVESPARGSICLQIESSRSVYLAVSLGTSCLNFSGLLGSCPEDEKVVDSLVSNAVIEKVKDGLATDTDQVLVDSHTVINVRVVTHNLVD